MLHIKEKATDSGLELDCRKDLFRFGKDRNFPDLATLFIIYQERVLPQKNMSSEILRR